MMHSAQGTGITRTIRIRYFALLRERRGLADETVQTTATTPRELYAELSARHGFDLPTDMLRVAVNDAYAGWDTVLANDDCVVFIQPVAGG